MVNKELMEDFETEFEKIKQELGFKATLKELESVFFLRDFIHATKFVSSSLSRQVCGRICETFKGWSGYLHGIVMPVPHSMYSVTENNMFDDDNKKEIMLIMKKIMEFTSRSALIGLTKDKKAEAEFIDETFKFWNDELNVLLEKTMSKVNQGWKKQIDEHDLEQE
ncbi:hypothetical protein HOK51_09025 [Candidatus Woesearchaeota archaeon]|jgi:hypothetical protein|nr:hypothetical protein [Candidatus Woesearchaeota archaeon]MBT6519971.1 hypothetical protein [Candidatus Woesearchaeota archaeon]MBT7367828.1 hypothetical protein [Candidatus Woesearchaeota archaeon]